MNYCFATRLKELRERQALTQQELGKLAGVNNTQISHYETGKCEPSLRLLLSLIKALEVEPNELLS